MKKITYAITGILIAIMIMFVISFIAPMIYMPKILDAIFVLICVVTYLTLITLFVKNDW